MSEATTCRFCKQEFAADDVQVKHEKDSHPYHAHCFTVVHGRTKAIPKLPPRLCLKCRKPIEDADDSVPKPGGRMHSACHNAKVAEDAKADADERKRIADAQKVEKLAAMVSNANVSIDELRSLAANVATMNALQKDRAELLRRIEALNRKQAKQRERMKATNKRATEAFKQAKADRDERDRIAQTVKDHRAKIAMLETALVEAREPMCGELMVSGQTLKMIGHTFGAMSPKFAHEPYCEFISQSSQSQLNRWYNQLGDDYEATRNMAIAFAWGHHPNSAEERKEFIAHKLDSACLYRAASPPHPVPLEKLVEACKEVAADDPPEPESRRISEAEMKEYRDNIDASDRLVWRETLGEGYATFRDDAIAKGWRLHPKIKANRVTTTARMMNEKCEKIEGIKSAGPKPDLLTQSQWDEYLDRFDKRERDKDAQEFADIGELDNYPGIRDRAILAAWSMYPTANNPWDREAFIRREIAERRAWLSRKPAQKTAAPKPSPEPQKDDELLEADEMVIVSIPETDSRYFAALMWSKKPASGFDWGKAKDILRDGWNTAGINLTVPRFLENIALKLETAMDTDSVVVARIDEGHPAHAQITTVKHGRFREEPELMWQFLKFLPKSKP